MDDARSWIVVTDANGFSWPGPDLRPARPGDAASVAYGLLPTGVFNDMRDRFLAAVRARKAGQVEGSKNPYHSFFRHNNINELSF